MLQPYQALRFFKYSGDIKCYSINLSRLEFRRFIIEGKSPIITLITDFGTKDPFVGQMKGVILSINPDALIVDITHEVAPHNIREGAIVTGLSYHYFPHGAIHVVVVDPGVGSGRRPILVATENHFFVGPDNDIFSMVYNKEKRFLRVFHLTAEQYFLRKDSPTFQGRDLFAPVAGWLSKGVPVERFGIEISDYKKLYLPEPQLSAENTIEGEVIYLDRFGNAITNIPSGLLVDSLKEDKGMKVKIKGENVSLKKSYADTEDRGLYCLINSFDLLEFFINQGTASKDYGISIGERVVIFKK